MKRSENNAFISFGNDRAGIVFDDSKNKEYPIKYYNVIGDSFPKGDKDCSYYGYVYEGLFKIKGANFPELYIGNGMYFSVAGEFDIESIYCGKVILIEVLHTKGIYPINKFKAMFTVGGAIEAEGRLKYIDGCTDSILIHPVKKGDPCFNHLHFPTNIKQTPHTHPSHRIGVVAKGNGLCVTPFGNLELKQGMIFVIKGWDGVSFATGVDGGKYEVGNHCFFTNDESMDVIAFHPDSDFGAEDENHPMINRTIVDGVSAANIDSIKTK